MISSRVTVMGSLCSVEGTQRPSPGPPNWWTCNLNLRTGSPRAVGPFLPGGLATMGPSPLSGRLRGSDAHVEEQARDEGDDMERQLESEAHIAAPPDVVREALATEPGRILAARPVPAQARSFPVE